MTAGAVFVVFNFLDWFVHDVVLGPTYMRPEYAALWNPKPVMNERMKVAVLAYVLFSLVFAKLYAGGYESGKAPLGQGARFGALAGVLVFGYHALTQYMVFPVSLSLVLTWLAIGVAECVLLGVVAALVYKPKPA